MQEIHFTDPQAEIGLTTLFKASRLIPFFGSGFTKDCRTKNGKIPDASMLVTHITDIASERPGLSPNESIEIKNIQTLKNAFGLMSMPEYVSPVKARTLLGNIFSDAKISDVTKIKVLTLDWPHIFTFNIDDAIENSAKRYKVLHPNRKVSREFIAANTCLFKIHGDIAEYIKYQDPNVIFTWRDYAHSIEGNEAMLSFLAEQASGSAFLFIGCSLDAELDLLHLSKNTPFKKSIFLKKGKLSLTEKISISDYGIEQVIYFDSYDEIYSWIFKTLNSVTRAAPYRELNFDDSPLQKDEAIKVITNGGPLSQLKDNKRVARMSQSFADRSAIGQALKALRKHECLLVTGRRFSGKTLFLFQLIWALKEYGATYYASTDTFEPSMRKLLSTLENHLFVFDSNYLNTQELDEVLHTALRASSKFVICASSGDAELFRFRLEARNVEFFEINLASILDDKETLEFNKSLELGALPLYSHPENLLSFAFRYYGEFKTKLGTSALFSKRFDDNSYSIMVLIVAFGKAESQHIECFNKYFDALAYVKANDRLFEIVPVIAGPGYIVVCNSSAWLLKTLGEFISKNSEAARLVANVIQALSKNGFTGASRNLISFDKLNELGGGSNVHQFIRNVYTKIALAYQGDMHYWLQRAKSELISGKTLTELDEGMGYASKVRLDSEHVKQQTYYSATLVLAQLNARAFKISNRSEYLFGFLDRCLESIRNYDNNRRHIDNMLAAKDSDTKFTLQNIANSTLPEILPRKRDVDELLNFFKKS